MKKHILSKYSERKNEGTFQLQISERTLITRAVESSDPDEFFLGPTVLTENMEASDPDEFTLQDQTIKTSQTEDSGFDEFALQAPTMQTFQKEDSDPDEFLVNTMEKYYEGDFDSILLI